MVAGRRYPLFLAFAALIAAPCLAQNAPIPGAFVADVTFTGQAPLAANAVLLRRLLTPRQAERSLAMLAHAGSAMARYPIDPQAERFAVYMPAHASAGGYGLLVFIPPWDDAELPAGWKQVLDRAGVIFVAAQRSGNAAPVAERRIPLALTAAHALGDSYRIDAARTYIGGFSGGSRVAMRLAVAYPDVFSGVLLDAGSDPLGGPAMPLPAPALMTQLQTRTRFVMITGEGDATNLAKDAETQRSLSDWCVGSVSTMRAVRIGHEVMDGYSFSRALQMLDRKDRGDPGRVEKCRANLTSRVAQALSEAATLRGEPRSPKTEAALDRLDSEYGGLLAPDRPEGGR